MATIMSQDVQFTAFCKILNFVNELNNVFGSKYKNIKKYYNLLKKSQSKPFAVSKQTAIFDQFVNQNKEFVISKDVSKLTMDDIVFSENNVFINLRQVITESDSETKDAIFKHLQVISYAFSNDEQIKQAILKDNKDNEGQFIDTFMQKVTNAFETQNYSDPLSATLGLLQSGIFNDVVQTLSSKHKSKEISIDKLVNKLQSTMSDMSKELGSSGIDVGPLNQLSHLSSLGGMTNIPSNPTEELKHMGQNTDNMLGNLMNMASGLLNKTGHQLDMSSLVSSVMMNMDPNMLQSTSGSRVPASEPSIQDITDMLDDKKNNSRNK